MSVRVKIFGKNTDEAESLCSKYNISIDEKNPNFVISFGGDGTLMRAEFAYPGVPKLILRNSSICKMCSPLSNDEVLQKFAGREFEIRDLIKINASTSKKTITAVNDIVVHNADARHAMRYLLWVDNKQIGDTIIGDGVVIATPLGSTGYYRSITDSYFENGLGLAFNNSIEQTDHVVLDDERQIKIKIIRGPAAVYADNQEERLNLDEGDTITISKSPHLAKWVVVK